VVDRRGALPALPREQVSPRAKMVVRRLRAKDQRADGRVTHDAAAGKSIDAESRMYSKHDGSLLSSLTFGFSRTS